MAPDFSKNTIDTIAKRASYICSNPDCRKNTIGPNSDIRKSTSIGEAAHIYGARKKSKRFNPKMTDITRSEITNAIWLCRNCHKLIDTDEIKYSSKLLYQWREKHEEYVALTLGNTTEKINYENLNETLKEFNNYPIIIKRIIIDKPDFWGYRLTAELMRFFNDPIFRKLQDLEDGLYIKEPEHISMDKAFNWTHDLLNEMPRLVDPAIQLLERLSMSWGQPNKDVNLNEIHHITKLISDYLKYVISFEEKIRFTIVPDEYVKIVTLFSNLIGSQVKKMAEIPNQLDEIVKLSIFYDENPENAPDKFEREIIFETPEGLENDFNKELKYLSRKGLIGDQNTEKKSNSGCGYFILIVLIIVVIFALI